jgi:transaldolase
VAIAAVAAAEEAGHEAVHRIGEIRELVAAGPLLGVTTDPSLIAKTGRRQSMTYPMEVL